MQKVKNNKGTFINDNRRFLMFFDCPTYNVRQFLTYNVRFFGAFLTPYLAKIINERSLMKTMKV